MAAPAIDLSLASPDELRAEIERLCAELSIARDELRDERRKALRLTSTVRDQAKTNAALVDECPSWAPSVAICYWKWSEARGGEKGWRQIWNCIRWLVADLGALPAPKLTAAAWDEHRARRRLHVTPRGGPPCEATLNLELVYAKAMLNFAVDREMIRRNPLERAKPVATISQRESRPTPGDIEKLLAAADDVVNRRIRDGDDSGHRAKLLRAFVLCLFDSMVRFKEALNMKLGRIESDGTYELLASEVKGKRRRLFKLTPRTLEAIREIERRPGATWVFEGPFDHPGKNRYGQISEGAMRSWFYRACEISGIDARASERDGRIRPHDLRAGGATAADEGGARARALQRVLGHRSLRTTERYLRSDDVTDATDVCEVMTRIGPSRAPRKGSMKKSA